MNKIIAYETDKENKMKVKIERNRYEETISMTTNNFQWFGYALTPSIAQLMITALKKYIKEVNR